jgi:hypothetical protein
MVRIINGTINVLRLQQSVLLDSIMLPLILSLTGSASQFQELHRKARFGSKFKNESLVFKPTLNSPKFTEPLLTLEETAEL